MKRHRSPTESISLHGDFWTRFLLQLLHILPVWLCLLVTRPLALVFYIMAAPQRKALTGNLRAMHPDSGSVALWWGGYRVFVQFALTYMDRLWSLHLGCPIRWEFRDYDYLVKLLSTSEGALLFTIHSGNYDIGAALFAQHSPRPVHIVRVPERTDALQELRATELKQTEHQHPQLRVHFVADEWTLGLELSRLLRSGEVVALQGDRVLSPTPPVVIDDHGVSFRLPRGPFFLAEISRVPCYPIFLTRLGLCHYQLCSGPAFYDGSTGLQTEEIARAWLAVMAPFVRQHWDQWFVFEQTLTRSDSLVTETAVPASPTPTS